MANQKNSTQADFDKQAAIDLVRAEALKVRELHDIFEVSERSICIIKDRPTPKHPLTPEKWQEWVENAPESERRKWAKDAMDFAKWLYDAMISETHSKDDPELQEYISNHPEAAGQIKEINAVTTYILVALNELIFYIEGKISVDADGYFLPPTSDGDSRPFFALAMSAAKRKPSVAEAIKISWEAWAVFFEEYGGRNPLGTSVEAFVLRPTEISAFKPKKRSQLAFFDNIEVEEAKTLIQLQPEPPTDSQFILQFPELQRTGSASWLLDLYKQVGGAENSGGRGAPWPMRLFVGGLLHVPIEFRDGEWHYFPVPTDEVVGWLYPDGWPNKKSRWESLPKALEEVNRLGWVYVPGVGSVQVFGASVIPRKPTDPFVQFITRVPPSAAHGARIDWPQLCKYGKESGPLYRAYLTACEFMHRSASNGQPVTKEIGQALLGPDGEPIRRKDKKTKKMKVVRSQTDFEPNPAARYVKGLNKAQLAEAIGLDAQYTANHGRALDAFERLNDDGMIDLQKEGRGQGVKYYIYGPNQWVDAQVEVIE